MPVEKSAGAIIFRKENKKIYYLLLHYQANHWGFAKGRIERGEKPEEAARREIKEETGIEKIKFLSEFKETIKYFYKKYPNKIDKEKTGKSIFKTVIFFLAQTKTKKVKISWEHKNFKWLSCQQALKQLTFKNAQEILEKANDFLN